MQEKYIYEVYRKIYEVYRIYFIYEVYRKALLSKTATVTELYNI